MLKRNKKKGEVQKKKKKPNNKNREAHEKYKYLNTKQNCFTYYLKRNHQQEIFFFSTLIKKEKMYVNKTHAKEKYFTRTHFI